MNVFSKLFPDVHLTCRDIVHPHTSSCFKAALGYFFKPVLSTMQFFLPLFMISIAARKDQLNEQVFWEMLRNFMGAVVAGLFSGSVGTLFMCVLYKILNRFTYYTLVAVPGCLGALSIFLVPNKIAVMFAHSAFVMMIEVLIRRRGSIFFEYLDGITWLRTLTFMTMSAVILNGLKRVRPDVSWFIQPVRHRSRRRRECYDESPVFDALIPVKENVCSHKKSCDEFILQELKTYTKVGIAIEIVRSTIKNIDAIRSNAFKGIFRVFRKFNFKFALFAIGYPSIYRVLTCALSRWFGLESELANVIAAFAAGATFYAYPGLSFLSYAIACAIEIAWQRLQKSKRKKFSLIRKVHKMPIARIAYSIFMGILFHVRTFYPWQTPSLVHRVMNYVSCKHTDEMLMNIYALLIPTSI